MELQKLISALRSGAPDQHRCLGCGYEHNCGIHGCQLMKQAADQLEQLQRRISELEQISSAEKQACFRLGQMDMRASAAAALQEAAKISGGITGAVLLCGVDLINSLEVTGHD